MKNYELLTVFKPSLDSEELDKAIEKISEEVKSYTGSVVSVDKMGNIIVSTPAESIVEFKRNLKLNDNVLRFMFMEVSKKAQTV